MEKGRIPKNTQNSPKIPKMFQEFPRNSKNSPKFPGISKIPSQGGAGAQLGTIPERILGILGNFPQGIPKTIPRK